MNNYRYILEPYKGINTRFECPGCGKKHIYTRYIDTHSNQYLPFDFGKCNREINCGYHKNPYNEKFTADLKFDQDKKIEPFNIWLKKHENSQPSFHPFSLVQKSLKQYEHNAFVIFLYSKFGESITARLINEYFIGTSEKYRKSGNGAVVFWNIDINGKVRNGKIIGYDPTTGKRIKEPFVLQNWVHTTLKIENFNISHCYFGEHLIRKYPFKEIAVVESEKTAIICSVFLPNYVWVSSGNLRGITFEKSKVFKGRDVILFPDLSENGKAFQIWENKLDEIRSLTKSIKISDTLEKLAPNEEKLKGYDLEDYFSKISIDQWKKLNSNQKYFFDEQQGIYLNENGFPASLDFKEDPINRNVFKSGFERISFNDYVGLLRFEDGILINGDNYPADWDTIANNHCIDLKTKQFISMAIQNPILLDVQKSFDLR
jgi:hypothetical protein